MGKKRFQFFSAVLVSVAACSPPSGGNDAGAEAGSIACRSDRECATAGLVCDRALGQCVQCVANNDCLAGNQRCTRGQCVAIVPCMTSRQCPGQVCDQVAGQCVDCIADNDCMTTELCREARCIARPTPCRSSRECSAAAQVCDPTRMECVDCVAAMDCASGEQCVLNRCVRGTATEAGPEPAMVDVLRPNDDAVSLDVVSSDASVDTFVPPDVSVMPDAPDGSLSPEDRCPGALLPMGTPQTINWSRVRMGSDSTSFCGSGAFPGAWRDVLYRVDLPRGGDLRVSVTGATLPVAFELRDNCTNRVMPEFCFLTPRDNPTFTRTSQYYPPGAYFLAVEARESELPPNATITVQYATMPSPWTYTLSQPSDVQFVDVCAMAGATQRLRNSDDGVEAVPSPFHVQVFDTETSSTTSRVWVAVNGWLSLANNGRIELRSLTTPDENDGALAVLSEDLVATERGVCTLVMGTAPQRRLIVQWDRMRAFGGDPTADITMEAIIYERTETAPNVIDVVYRSLVRPPAMPVVGLRGSFLDSFTAPAPTAPVVYRYTPRRR